MAKSGAASFLTSRMCQRVNRFSRETSMHGMYKICDATSSMTRRALWLVLLLVSIASLLGCINLSVVQFLQYDTYVGFHQENEIPQEFPAVTICTGKSFRKSLYVKAAETIKNHIIANSNNLITNGIVDELVSVMLRRYLIELGASERANFGIDFDEFITLCTYQYEQCWKENFTHIFSLKFGNCYTFSSLEHPQLVTDTSMSQGLNLEFDNTNIKENFTARKSASIKDKYVSNSLWVMIHNPRHLPDESSTTKVGKPVPLYGQTMISVEKYKEVREPHPYKPSCIHSNSEEARKLDWFPYLFDGVEYSPQGCQLTCRRRIEMRYCGCVFGYYVWQKDILDAKILSNEDRYYLMRAGSKEAAFGNATLDFPAYVCRNMTAEVLPCLRESWKLWLGVQYKNCTCPRPCTQVHYETTATYIPDEIRIVNGTIDRNRPNLLISFGSLETHVVTHNPVYDSRQLLSDIGGFIGLLSGLSIITVLEILELAIDFGILACTKTNEF